MRIKQLSETLTEKQIAQIIQLKDKNSLNKIIEELRNLTEFEPFNLYFLKENKVIDLNRLYSICQKETKENNFYFKKEIIECLIKSKLIELKNNLVFATENLKNILNVENKNDFDYDKKRIELLEYLKEQTRVKTKFKVGMTIKRIHSLDLNLIKTGELATVLEISHDGKYLYIKHNEYGEFSTETSDWDLI